MEGIRQWNTSKLPNASVHWNEYEKPDKRKNVSVLKKSFHQETLSNINSSDDTCHSRTIYQKYLSLTQEKTVFIKQMNPSYFTYFFFPIK